VTELDALEPIAIFDAHGARWEIRQLVSGTLISCACGSEHVATWPAGMSVAQVRAAIERESPRRP
jgi:hypothetical protein